MVFLLANFEKKISGIDFVFFYLLDSLLVHSGHIVSMHMIITVNFHDSLVLYKVIRCPHADAKCVHREINHRFTLVACTMYINIIRDTLYS